MLKETTIQTNKMARWCEKISKIAIYLLVFLLPLFFLPWTADVLDFNKQALLLVLVFISLFCWLSKSLIEGKLHLNFSFFNLPVIIYLLILAIGTFFSLSPYGSFWGRPLNVAPSFLTIIGFILFYFLIINNFKKDEILSLLLIFIISSSLVTIYGGLQIFGKFILPFDFSKAATFNPLGTVNALGVLVAGILVLTSSLILISRGLMKLLFSLFGLAGLSMLFLINFWVAWIMLLIGTAVILIFGINRREIFQVHWLILPMVLLIVSLFFGVLKISIPVLPATPLEVSPSQIVTFNIAIQTLKDRIPISLLFGSGPSTFVFDYSKFKPSVINQTAFWGVRFVSGASEILDRLATTGILGLISFLGILGVFFFQAFKWLIKKTKTASPWVLGLGIFSSWLAITVGLFLYPFNLSLGFLFWFLTACFIVLIGTRVKTFTLESFSMSTIGASFLFILLLILGIGLLFSGGRRYIAEIRYLQGIRAFQRGDNQKAMDYLLSAVSHTGGRQDNYWRDLSQVYLFRVNEELLRKDISQEEIGRIVTPLIGHAVNSAKSATDVVSKNVANWTVRGFVYRNLINLINGAEEWAIISYQEAFKLEPTNPFIYTELGNVYLAKDNINEAREQFQKSLDLKPDYAPAHFQIAMIDIREGRTKEAIEKLEEMKQVAPFDQGLVFQLGVIYYNDNQFDKAKREFEKAVSLDPNYSNARYFLGIIYDREKNKDLAIEQFERIAQLNPENEEVKKILANLKEGRAALEEITPAQPPIEEKPTERLEK